MPRTVLFVTLVLAACGYNVLHLKYRRHYTERSILTRDTVRTAYQQACYDRRNVIDEGHCYYLRLRFPDTAAIHGGMRLDLERDTALVRADYGLFSIWNWSEERNTVRGTITVLEWSPGHIRLNERVRVEDERRDETRRFNGTRTFKPAEGW
jgi:hypothetical protein